jgi:uncharacterized membrane protein YkvA (DUF1232 family)
MSMWRLGRLFALLRTQGRLVWAMLRDPRAPWISKLVAVLAVAYVLSPVDLVSDLIPVLGWIDDGVIAYVLLTLAMKFLPPDLNAALRAQVQARQGRKGATGQAR